MEFIIIIAIIFAVINANNKKKQAEQQKQAQQRQADVRSLEADETRAAERLRDYQAERQKRQERGVQAAAYGADCPAGRPCPPRRRAGKRMAVCLRNNQPRRGEVLHVLRKAALWRKHELCFFGRHGRIHRGQSGPRLPWRSRAGDGPRACSPRLRSTACCEAAYGIDAPACGIQHNGH